LLLQSFTVNEMNLPDQVADAIIAKMRKYLETQCPGFDALTTQEAHDAMSMRSVDIYDAWVAITNCKGDRT